MKTYFFIPLLDIFFQFSDFSELAQAVFQQNPEIFEKKSYSEIEINFLIHKKIAENIATYGSEASMRGDVADKVKTQFLEMIGKENNEIKGVKISFCGNFDAKSPREQIEEILSEQADAIILCRNTDDDNPIAMWAKANGKKVTFVKKMPYTGRRKLKLDFKDSGYWCKSNGNGQKSLYVVEFQKIFPNERRPKPFEMFDFGIEDYGQTNNNWGNIGYYDPKQNKIIQISPTGAKGNKDRGKSIYESIELQSPGQAMAMSLLNNEDVNIVVLYGEAGCGKTFATALYVAQSIERNTYDRIIYLVSEGNRGQDVGFLPGNLEEKINAKTQPFKDNMRTIVDLITPNGNNLNGSAETEKSNAVRQNPSKQQRRNKKNQCCNNIEEPLVSKNDISLKKILDHIDFDIVRSIEGRSLKNTLMIIEEGQHSTYEIFKQDGSRCGEGSKVIILGAPDQVLSKKRNVEDGISVCVHFLENQKNVGILKFEESENLRRGPSATFNKAFNR